MDKGKILLAVAVACYSIALLFFWIATSGLTGGWYKDDRSNGDFFSYGTLSYTITTKSDQKYSCDYVDIEASNSTTNNTSPCESQGVMAPTGEFVLVDTIFAWLCLMPALGCLIAFSFFNPSLGLAKVAWGLGAVTFFWSIWGWIVFVIKFSGSGATPYWAWALNFWAFLLVGTGLILSIVGVRFGSTSYEVMGGEEQA